MNVALYWIRRAAIHKQSTRKASGGIHFGKSNYHNEVEDSKQLVLIISVCIAGRSLSATSFSISERGALPTRTPQNAPPIKAFSLAADFARRFLTLPFELLLEGLAQATTTTQGVAQGLCQEFCKNLQLEPDL